MDLIEKSQTSLKKPSQELDAPSVVDLNVRIAESAFCKAEARGFSPARKWATGYPRERKFMLPSGRPGSSIFALQRRLSMSRKLAKLIRFFGNYGYYRRQGFNNREAWQLAGKTLPT